MENTIVLAQIEIPQASETNQNSEFAELGKSQLALVGGGCGDVLWG